MSAGIRQVLFVALLVVLTACDDSKPPETSVTQTAQPEPVQPPVILPVEEKAQVLVYLDAKTQPAQFVMPKCKDKTCPILEIESLNTQDPWLNTWLASRIAHVLMQQIEQEPKNFSLQQAINRYVAASQEWQKQSVQNKAFELKINSEIAYQKNAIVLLKLQVNSHQGQTKVTDRLYFFVADRTTQKNLMLKDVIAASKGKALQKIVDQDYKKWLDKQDIDVKTAAPEQLDWKTAEWFYDQQGIGLHFRAGKISPTAEQLDIYLTYAQTQQVLHPTFFKLLFNTQLKLEEQDETKNRAA